MNLRWLHLYTYLPDASGEGGLCHAKTHAKKFEAEISLCDVRAMVPRCKHFPTFSHWLCSCHTNVIALQCLLSTLSCSLLTTPAVAFSDLHSCPASLKQARLAPFGRDRKPSFAERPLLCQIPKGDQLAHPR